MPRPVKCELPVEPVVTGDKGALGVLDLLGLLCVGEEGGERGFQLALRIGLSVMREEESGGIRQAVETRDGNIRNVVHQAMPFAALGQA